MKKHQKIIWSEGTVLTQQHFQQWERYFLSEQDLKFNMLGSHFWGVIEVDIDESALKNGIFSVEKCKAIFPDQEFIGYDQGVDDALCCDLNQCQKGVIDIYLCIPLNSHVKGLSGYESNGEQCGWSAQYEMVCDEYDCRREREIAFAKRSLLLLHGDQKKEACKFLKIAEIKRDSQGCCELISAYIPPTILIQFSLELKQLVKHLINDIRARLSQLQQKKKKHGNDIQAFYASEPLNFMLIGVLQAVIISLNNVDKSHPIKLYEVLVQFVGSLQLYAKDDNDIIVPEYEHDKLGPMLSSMRSIIRKLLDVIGFDNGIVFDFIQKEKNLYVVEFSDDDLFIKNNFYLVARIKEDKVVDNIHQKIKIASEEDLAKIVNSAMPGIEIQSVDTVPAGIALQQNSYCYQINKHNPYWENIQNTKVLALFIPDGLAEAVFEIIAVPSY